MPVLRERGTSPGGLGGLGAGSSRPVPVAIRPAIAGNPDRSGERTLRRRGFLRLGAEKLILAVRDCRCSQPPWRPVETTPDRSSCPRSLTTRRCRNPRLFQGLCGAGDETRTRDIQLGKLTLYQLSYARLIHRPLRLLGTRWFKSCPQVIANNTAFPERCPGNLRGQLQHSPDGLSYRS